MRSRDRLRVVLCVAGLLLPAVAWPQIAFEQGNFYRISELQIPDCAECKGQANLRIENLETQQTEVTFEVWVASSPASGFSAISYSLVFPPEFTEAEVQTCEHGLDTEFFSDYESTIAYTRFSASAVSDLELPGFSVHVLHRGAFIDGSNAPSTLTFVSRRLSRFNCELGEGSASPQIMLYPYPNYSQSFYSRGSLAADAEVAVRYAQRAEGGPGGSLQFKQGESNIELRESDTQGVLLDEEIFITASEAGERVRSISLNISYPASGQLYWRAPGDENFKLLPAGSTRIAGEMGTNEAAVFLRGLRIATGDSFSPGQASISLEVESTLGSQDNSPLTPYQVSVVRDLPVTPSTPSNLLTAGMFQFFRNLGLLPATPSEDEVMDAVASFCSRGVQTGAEGFYADSDGDAVPNNIEVRSGTDCRDSGNNDLIGGVSVRPVIVLGADEQSKISAFASQPGDSEQLGVSCSACVQLTAYLKETSGDCGGVTLPGNFEEVCELVASENKSFFEPGLSTIFWLGVDQYGNWASSGSSLSEQSVYLAPQINFGEDIVLSSDSSETGTLTTFLDISGADALSLKRRSTEYLSTARSITVLEDGVAKTVDGLRLPLTMKIAFRFTYENLSPGMRKVLELECDDSDQYALPDEKRFIDKDENTLDRFFATCGKATLYVSRGTQILPPQVRFAVYEQGQDVLGAPSEVLMFEAGASFRFRAQATGHGGEVSPSICSDFTPYAPPDEPLSASEGSTDCSDDSGRFEGMTETLPPDYVAGNVLRIVAEVEGRWSGDDSLSRNWWGISIPVLATAPLDSISEPLGLIAVNGNAFANIEVLPGSLLLRSTDSSSEAADLADSGVLSSLYVDASIGRPPFASSPVSGVHVFDFRMRMLSPALETPNFARIRLALADPVPTGGGSVARYNFAQSEWEYFRTGSEGSYYSAPAPCPGTVADSPVPEPWQSGLNAGHQCLLLHIVDDGANDADATPGSMAALVTTVPPGENAGSGGGSGSGGGGGSDLGQLLIVFAGLLAFAGSYDPLTLLGLLLVILLSVFQKRLNTRRSAPK